MLATCSSITKHHKKNIKILLEGKSDMSSSKKFTEGK
jgi:hypothetical protein